MLPSRLSTIHRCYGILAFLAAAILSTAVWSADGPLTPLPEVGTIKLRRGDSLLLRTPAKITRTAVADNGITDVVLFTPRECSLRGRAPGKTNVTFWFDDPELQPVTYLVEVK